MAKIEAMPITVERVPWKDVVKESRAEYAGGPNDSQDEVLKRAEKYIRARLTDYDRELEKKLRPRGDAIRFLRQRVIDKICEVYPQLRGSRVA